MTFIHRLNFSNPLRPQSSTLNTSHELLHVDSFETSRHDQAVPALLFLRSRVSSSRTSDSLRQSMLFPFLLYTLLQSRLVLAFSAFSSSSLVQLSVHFQFNPQCQSLYSRPALRFSMHRRGLSLRLLLFFSTRSICTFTDARLFKSQAKTLN